MYLFISGFDSVFKDLVYLLSPAVMFHIYTLYRAFHNVIRDCKYL
jgi:hypothetical protein